MKRKIGLIATTLFLPLWLFLSPAIAQDAWRDDTSELLDQGFKHYLDEEFPDAIVAFQLALAQIPLDENIDDPQRAEALFCLGICQYEAGIAKGVWGASQIVVGVKNCKLGGAAYERLFPLEDELRPDWEFFDLLNESFLRLGQVPEKRRAAWPNELKTWLKNRIHNAGVLYSTTDYKTALWCYEFSLNMASLLDADDESHFAMVFSNLANLHSYYGEFGQAYSYRMRAHRLYRKLGQPDDPKERDRFASNLLNHGAFLSQLDRREEAVKCFEECFDYLSSFKTLTPEMGSTLSLCLQHLSSNKQVLSQFPEALEHAQQAYAIDLARVENGERGSRYDLIQSLTALGRCNLRCGNEELGLQQLTNCLEQRKKLYPKSKYPKGHQRLFEAIGQVAYAHLKNKNYDQAKEFYEQAEKEGEKIFGDSSKKRFALIKFQLGRTYGKLGDLAAAKTQFLDAALMWNKMLARDCLLLDDENAFSYLSNGNLPTVEHLAGLAVESPELLDEELYQVVAARKSLVTELLRFRNSTVHSEYKSKKQRTLLRDYENLSRKLRDAMNESDLKSSEPDGYFDAERVAVLESELEACWVELCDAFEIRRDTFMPEFDLATLKKNIPDNSVFLDFHTAYIGYELNYVMFVVGSDRSQKIQLIKIGPVEEIDLEINGWLDDIQNLNGNDSQSRKQLASIFWDKILTAINTTDSNPQVIISSPLGNLNRLPWPALTNSRGRLAIKDYAFCFTGSANAISDLLSKPSNSANKVKRALAISNPDYTRLPSDIRKVLSSLPRTSVETDQLQAILEKPLQRLEGDHASFTEMVAALDDCELLHLAVHAIDANQGSLANKLENFRSDNPYSRMAIVLAPETGTPAEDYLAFADAISRLDLKKLVIGFLAICYGGEGSFANYEAIASIQSAFHLAGARTVVASLWAVDTSITSRISATFYKNVLRNSVSPIEALRLAQLDAMRNGPSANCDEPLNWASWRIESDPRNYQRIESIDSTKSKADRRNASFGNLWPLVTMALMSICVLVAIVWVFRKFGISR